MGDSSHPSGGSAVSAEGQEDHGDPTCLAQPQGLTLQQWGEEESPVLQVLNLNCLRDTQVKTSHRQGAVSAWSSLNRGVAVGGQRRRSGSQNHRMRSGAREEPLE